MLNFPCVIIDSREQKNWDFSFYGLDSRVGKLDTADYSLEGFEDVLCIERKASTSEIALNLGKKKKQFDAEIARMATYKYKFIICEFSVANLMEFPNNAGIPRGQLSKVRINPAYMLKCLNGYQSQGVEVIFAGSRDNAIQTALEIFEEVYNGLS